MRTDRNRMNRAGSTDRMVLARTRVDRRPEQEDSE